LGQQRGKEQNKEYVGKQAPCCSREIIPRKGPLAGLPLWGEDKFGNRRNIKKKVSKHAGKPHSDDGPCQKKE